MDIYHKLRLKFNSHPIGAPDLPEVYEIYKMLFTPEEASIVLVIPFSPKPVEAIAKDAGLTISQAIYLCEKLADKGLVSTHHQGDNKIYMLLPMMPGIFEYPFMKIRKLDLDYERLAKLWNDYYIKGFGQEVHGGKTSMTRVIPVQQAIESVQGVLPFEEASYYINTAELLSVGLCSCRIAAKKCKNPVETCFAFGGAARYLVERGMGRFIDKEEALKILEQTEKAGLVHMVSNTSEKIGMMCNCCSCCCVNLGYTKIKGALSHPFSNFYASPKPELCNLCGICESKCPVKAIKINDSLYIDANQCIGCGLCSSACPAGAIDFKRKDKVLTPPAKAKDLAIIVAKEKGRLNEFLDNIKT